MITNLLARARSTSWRLICSSPRTKCRWSSTKTFSRPNASINVVAEMPVRLGLARDPFSPLWGEGEDEGFLDVEAVVPAAPELREGGSAAGFPLQATVLASRGKQTASPTMATNPSANCGSSLHCTVHLPFSLR